MNFLYHERNLIGKINNNYKGKGNIFKNFKENVYNKYKKSLLEIRSHDKKAIGKKASILYEYYKEVDKLNKDNWITPQSKFRPTIIEEFCGFLFINAPEIDVLELGFFNKHIYSGITIDSNGNILIKKKDVDFCIGKKFKVIIGNKKYETIIPLIAIECKTYLDKTMFGEAQFTAQKLKQGSPDVRVYILTVENQIGESEIPSKGQTPIDQIFIIRNEDKRLDKKTFLKFFSDIRNVINKISNKTEIKKTGLLLSE